MIRFWTSLTIALAGGVSLSVAAPGSAIFESSKRLPTAAEIADGVPGASRVHEFFVTTTNDIVAVEEVNVAAPPYQHPQGNDYDEFPPSLFAMHPGLGADSWITTPGNTIVFNGFAFPNSLWGDLSDDGPVNHFMFAQLTAVGNGPFSGRVALNVGGSSQIEEFPFAFALTPEPASFSLAGVAAAGLITARRTARLARDGAPGWRYRRAGPRDGKRS